MTLRTPNEFVIDVSNAHAALDRLADQYGWAYHYALSPGRGDGQGSGQIAYSDPTLGVVEDPRRAKIREVLGRVNFLTSSLQAERSKLERMIGAEDEIRPRGSFPRTVSRAELEESKRAQMRRRIRAEHYGS